MFALAWSVLRFGSSPQIPRSSLLVKDRATGCDIYLVRNHDFARSTFRVWLLARALGVVVSMHFGRVRFCNSDGDDGDSGSGIPTNASDCDRYLERGPMCRCHAPHDSFVPLCSYTPPSPLTQPYPIHKLSFRRFVAQQSQVGACWFRLSWEMA